MMGTAAPAKIEIRVKQTSSSMDALQNTNGLPLASASLPPGSAQNSRHRRPRNHSEANPARGKPVDIRQQLRRQERERVTDPHRQYGYEQPQGITSVAEKLRIHERVSRSPVADKKQQEQEQAAQIEGNSAVSNAQQQQRNRTAQQTGPQPIDFGVFGRLLA